MHTLGCRRLKLLAASQNAIADLTLVQAEHTRTLMRPNAEEYIRHVRI
jgi:hypothetical protein